MYTGACFLISLSSFSYTSAALTTECEAATYNSNGAPGAGGVNVVRQSDIASALRRLSVELV
jgi:hypothetical protein